MPSKMPPIKVNRSICSERKSIEITAATKTSSNKYNEEEVASIHLRPSYHRRKAISVVNKAVYTIAKMLSADKITKKIGRGAKSKSVSSRVRAV